jgi:hypothetical protein
MVRPDDEAALAASSESGRLHGAKKHGLLASFFLASLPPA